MSGAGLQSGVANLSAFYRAVAAIASGVNQTVRLPRARRAASYSAQLVTRCRCFAMWRRQAALALNGTAEIQASGKGQSSYTAQLPAPNANRPDPCNIKVTLRSKKTKILTLYEGSGSTPVDG